MPLPFEPDPRLSVSARTPDGDTPLHLVVQLGDVKVMEMLITGGAEVDAVGDMGSTPLHFAVLGGNPEAVRCLLKCGANRSLVDEFQRTPEEAALATENDALKAAFGENAA